MNWNLAGLSLLFAAVLISAIGVVYSKHQSRALFIELQDLQSVRDELSIDWGRLQLEQSTWAAHGRVERIAAEQLQMRVPTSGATVTVGP